MIILESMIRLKYAVFEKLKKYKRKLTYGTEEYEIVFSKLYEEKVA